MAAAMAVVLLMSAGCATLAPTPVDTRAGVNRMTHATLHDPAVVRALDRAGLGHAGDVASPDVLVVAAWTLRPELAEARLLHGAAVAEAQSAARRPNPVLSLTPEFTRGAAGISPWTIAVAFAVLIENPSVREARVAGAQSRASAAQWQVATVAWTIAAQVRQSWRALRDAERLLEVATREDALAKERALLSRRRFDAGLVARADMERSESQRLQSEFASVESLRKRTVALFRLAAAVGVPSDELVRSVEHPEAEMPTASLDAEMLREAALFDRIDLAMALALHGEADAMWRGAVAARFSGLTLAPGYSFDRGERKWSVGASAELPLFDSHAPAIEGWAFRRDAAAKHVEVVQSLALGQLSAALHDLETIQQSLATAQGVVDAREHVVDVATRRREAGASGRDPVYDARAELLSAERTKYELEAQLSAAVDALEAVVQRPVWPASALSLPTMTMAVPAAGAHDVLE